MPGRGRFWERGALNDEIVEEADLVPELQDKVNTAAGGVTTVEDEGTPLPTQTNMNFTGAGVTASDSGGKTVVDIPGGGGGGASNFPDSVPFNDDNSLREAIDYDEFNYNTGALASLAEIIRIRGWEANNSGALNLGAQNVFNGDLGLETGANSGNGVSIHRASHFLGQTEDFFWKSIITIPSVIVDKFILVGLTNNQAAFNINPATAEAQIDTGFWFRFSQDDDPQWQVRIKDGIIDTTTDTGVTVVADTAFNFEIIYDVSTTTVTFKINGVQVHQATSNLPEEVAALFQIITQANLQVEMICLAHYSRQTRVSTFA